MIILNLESFDENELTFNYITISLRSITQQSVVLVQAPIARSLSDENDLCNDASHYVMTPQYLTGENTLAFEGINAVEQAIMCYKYSTYEWSILPNFSISVGMVESITLETSIAVVNQPVSVVLEGVGILDNDKLFFVDVTATSDDDCMKTELITSSVATVMNKHASNIIFNTVN